MNELEERLAKVNETSDKLHKLSEAAYKAHLEDTKDCMKEHDSARACGMATAVIVVYMFLKGYISEEKFKNELLGDFKEYENK